MICKNCGYTGDGKFCPKCGSPLVAEQVQPNATTADSATTENGTVAETPKTEASSKNPIASMDKAKLFKLIGICVGAMVALIVLILVIKGCAGSKGNWTTYDKSVIMKIEMINDKITLITSDGKMIDGPDEDRIGSCYYSADRTSGVCVLGDTLYAVNVKSFTKIDEDVRVASLSLDGTGVAYISDNELYLYNISKKSKSDKITDELYSTDYVVLSPDGDSLAYIDEDRRCHLVINGKEKDDTIKEAYPIALANSGKYFYYVKDSKFYVMPKDKDAEKLGEDISVVTFNEDLTQAVYSYNGKTYFCEKGKKADENISSKGSATIVAPKNAIYAYYKQAYYCFTADLGEQVYSINGDVYYVNSKMSADRIVSDPRRGYISENGKSLVYIKNGRLYRMDKISSNATSEELATSMDFYVSNVYASDDLKDIYVVTDDDELYYINSREKATKLYDDKFKNVCVMDDILYFIGDYGNSTGTGYLFCSDGGSKPKKIVSTDDVNNLYGISAYIDNATNQAVLFFTQEDTVNTITGTKNPKKLYTIE